MRDSGTFKVAISPKQISKILVRASELIDEGKVSFTESAIQIACKEEIKHYKNSVLGSYITKYITNIAANNKTAPYSFTDKISKDHKIVFLLLMSEIIEEEHIEYIINL